MEVQGGSGCYDGRYHWLMEAVRGRCVRSWSMCGAAHHGGLERSGRVLAESEEMRTDQTGPGQGIAKNKGMLAGACA